MPWFFGAVKDRSCLQIDTEILAKAEKYAQQQGVSLSFLVQQYLNLLLKTSDQNESMISPFVKGIGGVAALPEDWDERAIYRKYINEKHA